MSKVIVVRQEKSIRVKNPSAIEYRQLIQAGLSGLSRNRSVKSALVELLPGRVIGMKTNCLAGKANSTPVALVEGLGDLLLENRFDENDLVVWERSNRELAAAGYALNASSFGRRFLGTDTEGVGYGQEFHTSGEVNSLVSRIMTDLIDYNINLPVLKDHSIAGLSASLKNMYGAINNPNKFHDNSCDPFAAQISNLAPIRQKNRLTIIDATKVQYQGGPGYMGQYLEYYNGLIISDDPVAADRIGLEILERIRSRHGQPSLEVAKRPAKYLDTAQRLGLGTADLARIDLEVIEVDMTGRTSVGKL